MKEVSKFELLRDKTIFAILDGDTQFGEIDSDEPRGNIRISMPYLSGPTIVSIATRFGQAAVYGSQSRWCYFDDLMKYCIEHERMSDLLSYLFSKERFSDILAGYDTQIIENAYSTIITYVIEAINNFLHFGGNELFCVNGSYIIHQIGTAIAIAAPKIKTIDRKYISEISERAMKDVEEGNYDSAITKSRTLLEEVFCYAIEKEGEKPSESGNAAKLYSQVKSIYNMHQNKELDKRINELLHGLECILIAISEMRNKDSDSHGVGMKRINIDEHHARLFVNSSMTMADFILSVCLNKKK